MMEEPSKTKTIVEEVPSSANLSCEASIAPISSGALRNDTCSAQVKVRPFEYRWVIKNFKAFYNEKKPIESPVFSPSGGGSEDNVQLTLEVGPSLNSPDSFLSLQMVNHSELNLTLKTKFVIIDSSGDKCCQAGDDKFYVVCMNGTVGKEEFVRWDEIFHECSGLLANDELEIICEGAVVVELIDGTDDGSQHSQLSNHFNDLLESGRFSDVTLIVGHKQYPVHKAVLSVRSSVFSDMFEKGLPTEHQLRCEGGIHITDVEAHVFAELLAFIYTGKVKDIKKFSEQLLAAADVYALHDLKLICEKEVASKISVKNAARILLLAHRHSSIELKAKVMDFIVRNSRQVSETNDWKKLEMCHSELVVEAFKALAIARDEEIACSQLA